MPEIQPWRPLMWDLGRRVQENIPASAEGLQRVWSLHLADQETSLSATGNACFLSWQLPCSEKQQTHRIPQSMEKHYHYVGLKTIVQYISDTLLHGQTEGLPFWPIFCPQTLQLADTHLRTVCHVACRHLTSATNILKHYWRHICLICLVTFYISAFKIFLLLLPYLLTYLLT